MQFGTPFSYETIKDNDEQCFLLTRLKKDVLECWIIYLKNYHSETYRTGIPSEDQIILTLVRLRHDITFEVLAYLKGIGKTTATTAGRYYVCYIEKTYSNGRQRSYL